jgi:hypothetical protein
MKSLVRFVFVSSVILFSCDNDQQVNIATKDISYFPLQIGNRWEYEPIRTDMKLKTSVFTIVSTEIRDSKEYFAMERLYQYENTSSRDTVFYRIDPQGFVFETSRYDTGERNRFRLGAADGDTWNMESSAPDNYVVRTSITDVTLSSQLLHDCKSFSYDVPQWADEEHYFILAPGLGIVQHGNAWGFDYKLKTAKIAGL